MKVIDVQTQMTTRKGALFPEAAKDFFEAAFKTKIPYYQTEQEMMDVFRKADARVILIAPTADKTDFGEIKDLNDYTGQLKKDYPDTVYSFWLMPNIALSTYKWIKEIERCIQQWGSAGIYYNGFSTGVPASDKKLYPYYELCQEAGVPVKISVGHTAAGAGMPGGMGLHIHRTEHPLHIDEVAADFPYLNIIAAHCPWPYHNEMISVMLHKANVTNDLHGWLPKYYPPEIKREINGRLKHRFHFGSDYPFFSFERLFDDWQAQGFSEEATENVFFKNIQRVFGKD